MRCGRGWARRRATAAVESHGWDTAATAVRGVLCRGGSAGRPLRAPEPASRRRSSAPCSPPRTCRCARLRTAAGRRGRSGLGADARARDPRAAPRPHRRRAHVAARAGRPAARPIPRPGSAWPWGAGARRSPDGRPWTRCSCGARPGWAGPARGRRRYRALWGKARALRARRPRPRPRPAGRRPRRVAHGADGRARARGLRQHGRGAAPHARGAARRDRLLGGAEPPRGRGRGGPGARSGAAPAWSCWARPTASARGPSSRAHGLDGRRPLVGLHASGGRPVKQWDLGRWREVAARLQREFGATVLLTGTRGRPRRWRRRSRAASAARSATSPASSPCSTPWP